MNQTNPLEQMSALASRIQKVASVTSVEFTSYPSGGAMIDVRKAGRLFVMSYSPGVGFGVDEVHDGEGFLLGYKFASEEFEVAEHYLWKLVTDSQTCAADVGAS